MHYHMQLTMLRQRWRRSVACVQARNGSRTVMKGAANKAASKAKQAAGKATKSAKQATNKASSTVKQNTKKTAKQASPPKGARKTVRYALSPERKFFRTYSRPMTRLCSAVQEPIGMVSGLAQTLQSLTCCSIAEIENSTVSAVFSSRTQLHYLHDKSVGGVLTQQNLATTHGMAPTGPSSWVRTHTCSLKLSSLPTVILFCANIQHVLSTARFSIVHARHSRFGLLLQVPSQTLLTT